MTVSVRELKVSRMNLINSALYNIAVITEFCGNIDPQVLSSVFGCLERAKYSAPSN